MSTPDTTTPETPGLLSKIVSLASIERVVTFVVGPIVIAGSGLLSAWLSTKAGIPVTPKVIEGSVASGGLAAGGIIYKWLDGRSKHTLQELSHKGEALQPLLGTVGVTPAVEEGVIHTTLADLERMAQHAASKAVAEIHKITPPPVVVEGKSGGAAVQAQPPPPAPIPAATTDPAPATPVQAQPAPAPVVGQAADAGAATGQ